MSNKYKWRLTWAGEKDSPRIRAAFEHVQSFPLVRDSKARLIDHEEYMSLVEAKKVAPPESYWQIKEGEVGMISLSSYQGYTKTWNAVSVAAQDFAAGWAAAEKHLNNEGGKR